MPEISRFFGIAVTMYHNDHGVPHFHAYYGVDQASFAIGDLQILEGKLSRRAARLVREWAKLHRKELEVNWQLARRQQPLNAIEPLR